MENKTGTGIRFPEVVESLSIEGFGKILSRPDTVTPFEIYPSQDKPRWVPLVSSSFNAPLVINLMLGNGTAFIVISFTRLTTSGKRLFVGIERKGCFFFPFGRAIYPTYVEEKLNLAKSDANHMADWINAQIGIIDVPEFGNYSF